MYQLPLLDSALPLCSQRSIYERPNDVYLVRMCYPDGSVAATNKAQTA
jgi:hypothetical protein